MASAYYSNTQHIDFESVLAMDDPGMVSMFQAIMASGLEGFLGCPAVIFEAALVDFFENASVQDGVIISTVAEQLVEISEEWFADSFDLPVDGLADLSEIPKDVVFDARSIVSMSGRVLQCNHSGKFSMLTAVVCGVRMNWASVLFNILKKMVTPGSKQAKGFAVQISLLLENIPNLELGESSEFPASKILTEKTVHRYVSLNDKVGAVEAAGAPKPKAASKKRPADVLGDEPVVKKKRTMKKKSSSSKDKNPANPPADEVAGATVDEEASDEGDYEETADDDAARVNEPASEPAVADIVNEEPSTADNVDVIIEQVLADTAQIRVDGEDEVVRTSGEGNQPAGTAEERQWFNLPYDDLIARWDVERIVTTPSDTDEEIETERAVGTADGVQTESSHPVYTVEELEDMEMSDDERSVDELIDADEKMSLDEIILTIPAELPLPSAEREVSKITIGKEIKIPGVDENTWYLDRLPQIPVDDKGKEPLQLKDPIKGKLPQEHYFLICADIDLLVQLREKVIDEVAKFFYSFSLKRLANIQIDDSYFAKEELVLSWAEAESTRVALQRKMYILLKYRAVLVRKYLDGWIQNFVPGEGDSAVNLKVIDLISDLLSFVLEELKQQAVAHGIRWDRSCCSRLFEGRLTSHRVIPAYTIFEVSSQRQYDDTLPLVSDFFKLMKKRWADVCIEAVEFFVSGRLIPVGSINFCRSLQVFQPAYSFSPRQPTVFALRVSQFCTVFVDYSLFRRLPTEDITSFVASIASERTVLRNVQIAQNIVSVALIVQLIDEHSSSDSTSDDISMDFADQDTAAAASISLPAAPIPDVLRASIEQINERDDGAKHKDTLLFHLHHLERNLTARLDAHDRVLGPLRRDSNDQRNLMSMDIKSSHKQLSTQIASNALDVVDVQRVVRENHQELNAKTLNVITDQLSELVAYINRGGNGKKGEVSSSRPPPDNQNRGSGNTGGGRGDIVRTMDITQRDIDNAQRNILERLMNADRARERERRTVDLFGGIQQMEEFSRSVVGLFSAVGLFRGNQQVDSSRAYQQTVV
ncbi:hypothetical protein F511_18315 [Dorcoceras hygrometricum]|uniref:Dystroglycan-like n=1 Tax=Dorcoceras hygrometricum TaxID=472368 RepID=A0A2Z7D8U8_9LAMI|nr:hypothetical protein F511_18315 [Dorcoceras hygrometricum]